MSFRAALIQQRASRDVSRNVKDLEALVAEAAASGASYVQTPEVCNIFEPDKERLKAVIKDEAADDLVCAASGWASRHGIHLHLGSVAVKAADSRIANRSLVIAPDGRIIARYDKLHLFDIDLPNGESYRESATYAPGAHATTVQLPQAKFGLAICYDVRFPRLANMLANGGARVICYPAAFTVPTGEAHWHVLLRARAIETGSFVLAAAQGGTHDGGKSTYGHSLIISPWGEVLAEAATDPCVISAVIDPEASALARQRIPALRHARDFALQSQ